MPRRRMDNPIFIPWVSPYLSATRHTALTKALSEVDHVSSGFRPSNISRSVCGLGDHIPPDIFHSWRASQFCSDTGSAMSCHPASSLRYAAPVHGSPAKPGCIDDYHRLHVLYLCFMDKHDHIQSVLSSTPSFPRTFLG